MKISTHFEDLKRRNEKALVAFFTAGDQPLTDLHSIIETLAEGGADVIEIGLPFSDPFGEGPVIQGSSQRSLDNGTSTRKVLDELAKKKLPVPIVTMGYYNPILKYGLDSFARDSFEAGASGSIISDLIPDEAEPWCNASAAAGIETIFLVAPTSTEQRMNDVVQKTSGFIYGVSRTGVTGAEVAAPDVSKLVSELRSKTEKPICIGFGISRPEHVREVCKIADGAVVGSRIVDILHTSWKNPGGPNELKSFIVELKSATKDLG